MKDYLVDQYRELKEELDAVRACPFFYFEPWGDQKKFLKSKAKIRLIIGGNRTGKSTVGIIETISRLKGFRPDGSKDGLQQPPVDVLAMVGDRRTSVDKVVMSKVREFCPKEWIKHIKKGTDGYPEVITLDNGSRLYLGSYNQQPDTHEGRDWHGAWFDEPPPRPLWISIRRGLLDHAAPAWMTFTGLGCPWIYNELFCKSGQDRDENGVPRVESFHLDLLDSPHISEDEKESFMKDLTPWEIEVRVRGKFGHLQGVVFPEFDLTDHLIPPEPIPKDWPKFMIMDPHDRRPCYMLWAAVSPRDQIIFYREWPREQFHSIKTCGKSVRDYAALIRTEEGQENIYERIIDPQFGRTPSVRTGSTLVEEYSDHGLDFFSEINNDIPLGHQRIHEALRTDIGEPRILVQDHLSNLVWAFLNYSWRQEDMEREYGAKERVGEAGKDMIDAVRYLLDYEPNYSMQQFHGGMFSTFDRDRGIAGY